MKSPWPVPRLHCKIKTPWVPSLATAAVSKVPGEQPATLAARSGKEVRSGPIQGRFGRFWGAPWAPPRAAPAPGLGAARVWGPRRTFVRAKRCRGGRGTTFHGNTCKRRRRGRRCQEKPRTRPDISEFPGGLRGLLRRWFEGEENRFLNHIPKNRRRAVVAERSAKRRPSRPARARRGGRGDARAAPARPARSPAAPTWPARGDVRRKLQGERVRGV